MFAALKSNLPDRYLGFKECQDEVMRYLVEIEGWDAHDKLCKQLMAHLEQAGEKFRIMNGTQYTHAYRFFPFFFCLLLITHSTFPSSIVF